MDLSVVTDLDSFSKLRGEWNELLARAETSSIFQTFEWHFAWLVSFAPGNGLRVILAREGGALLGIAPLVITKQIINGRAERELSFIGTPNYASDYANFIVEKEDPGALEAILSWVIAHRNEWTMANFSNVPSHSPSVASLTRAFKNAGIKTISRVSLEAPAALLNDRRAAWELCGKKSLRRHYNWFKKHGTLEFKHCDSIEEIDSYLDRFFDQHIARRALAGAKSLFLIPAEKDFYRKLVRELFPQGWLRFGVLLFDGKPIAFHFGFEHERKFIWYKPAFDAELQERSPGEVLLKHLLEFAIERNLTEFDFTVGSEPFKYRFSNIVRTVHQVRAYNRFLSYLAAHIRLTLSRALKRPQKSPK
jgi:CelD/BcsL family acetyltransferase involved in cellulose biosynthesis